MSTNHSNRARLSFPPPSPPTFFWEPPLAIDPTLSPDSNLARSAATRFRGTNPIVGNRLLSGTDDISIRSWLPQVKAVTLDTPFLTETELFNVVRGVVHFLSFPPRCSPSRSLVKHDGYATDERGDQYKNRERSSVENIPHTGSTDHECRE